MADALGDEDLEMSDIEAETVSGDQVFFLSSKITQNFSVIFGASCIAQEISTRSTGPDNFRAQARNFLVGLYGGWHGTSALCYKSCSAHSRYFYFLRTTMHSL